MAAKDIARAMTLVCVWLARVQHPQLLCILNLTNGTAIQVDSPRCYPAMKGQHLTLLTWIAVPFGRCKTQSIASAS